MQEKTGMTQRQYAERIGQTQQAVSKMIHEGRIPLMANGRIDPALADKWRARHITQLRVPVATAMEEGAKEYRQARTEHETYRAKRERILYERLTGKLLDADKVLHVAEQAFTNVRVRLRALPRSLAPVLATMGNRPADIESTLMDAIDGALESLSEDVFATNFRAAGD